jgi:1-acyl-sn-glycerol-3-phosphate acyltransferase
VNLWLVIPIAWLAFAVLAGWLLDNPREDVPAGLLWHFSRLYSRVLHRVRYVGLEHLPKSRPPGSLILVSNHASGVDPILIIAACRFEARFIMARDMRAPVLEPLWRFANIILVDRQNRDASGTREAIRHVKEGGAIAIFPEGGIERPPCMLKPFQAGVGLLIRRTGAPVLPVLIRGAPGSGSAWSAYWTPSRTTIEFKPPIRYTGEQSPHDIAADLQRRYEEWTGWPVMLDANITP